MQHMVSYAGYGANRDPDMIRAITGTEPASFSSAIILNSELCVQRIDQAPADVPAGSPANMSVKDILELDDNWGKSGDFETYTLRRKQGGMVLATLFELTAEQRELIAEWEMIDYGWYQRMDVLVRSGGSLALARTEGLRSGQEIDRVADGLNYPTYLNSPAKMHQIAERTRLDFLTRQ